MFSPNQASWRAFSFSKIRDEYEILFLDLLVLEVLFLWLKFPFDPLSFEEGFFIRSWALFFVFLLCPSRLSASIDKYGERLSCLPIHSRRAAAVRRAAGGCWQACNIRQPGPARAGGRATAAVREQEDQSCSSAAGSKTVGINLTVPIRFLHARTISYFRTKMKSVRDKG